MEKTDRLAIVPAVSRPFRARQKIEIVPVVVIRISMMDRHLLIASACLMLGCELVLPTKPVTVEIGTLPEHLRSLPVEAVVVRVPHAAVTGQPGDSVEQRVPKHAITPVVAEYRVEGVKGVELVSGGFAVPGRPVTLRWREGRLARLLLRVAEAGDRLDWFDIERLREAVADIQPSSALDVAALEAAFQHRVLARGSVRELPTAHIEVSTAGVWILVDPSESRVFRSYESFRVTLPLGTHWLARSGSSTIASLFVGTTEWIFYEGADPGSVLSGTL